jgi:outer membrane biosynthesis protein TonB
MLKRHVSAFVFAIIFIAMPVFSSASPALASDNNEVAALRKAIRYPQWAIDQQIAGKFDLLVYVNEFGEVTSVTFDEPAGNNKLRLIIAEVSQKVSKHRFSSEYAGQTLRIPFRFIAQ